MKHKFEIVPEKTSKNGHNVYECLQCSYKTTNKDVDNQCDGKKRVYGKNSKHYNNLISKKYIYD